MDESRKCDVCFLDYPYDWVDGPGAVLKLKMWFLFVVSLNSFKFRLKADCGILSIIGNP